MPAPITPPLTNLTQTTPPETSPRRPWLLGLTGGIGSGKSTVARLFAAQGITVIDTDAIAHRLTAPGGQALPALVEAFGPAVMAADGSMDRAVMRQKVFGDPAVKTRLEGILHPLIRAETARQCAAAPVSDTAPYVLVDIPLLTETGFFRSQCQRVLVVDCPPELQIARVKARNSFDEAQIRAILDKQANREARLAIADEVIVNDGTMAAVETAVLALHQRYLRLSASAASA